MHFQANFQQQPQRYLNNFGDDQIRVTNHMLTKQGKAWIPVMGELHYSRVPCDKWEETLQKMKEGGIEVVASYVFWIHHEEAKGQYDFSGNRDIASFIRLCHKLGLEFFLRIGPWAHGECRNGGFPDWLVEECAGSLRSERDPYFSNVRRYIYAVAEQIRGLPLLGIQVENEQKDNAYYIDMVRQVVLEAGLTAPLYTATGWGSQSLPDTVLPMFGGYPEAPWEEHTRELEPNPNYLFSHQYDDGIIGCDLLGADTQNDQTVGKTPFMTCELGGGNQVTYHRRPLFVSRDIEALAICKLGSGLNLLGYYMYTGGINPIGTTTMQESKETGYPNDYPIISYDFQSPIGDMGQLRETWYRLSYIHQFIRSFGEMLAPMQAIMPDKMPTSLSDMQTLRCALRSDGNGGFLFINNHIRLHEMPAHPGHEFKIDFSHRQVCFTLNVPADSTFFIPVNISAAGLQVLYATAQPVSIAEKRLELLQIPGLNVPADSTFFIPVNISVAGLQVLYATAQPVCMTENRLELLQIPGLNPTITLNDGRTILLEVGTNQIDQTEVILLPDLNYVPSALTEIPVEPVENRCDANILLGHLHLEDLTSEYRVQWTAEDKWLVIKAKGNLAGFYAEGHLISDFYLYGDSWVIDLSALPVHSGIIKIQPFIPEDKEHVYLEVPFECGNHIPQVYTCKEGRLFI